MAVYEYIKFITFVQKGVNNNNNNNWLGPINSSPAADRMSDEIFEANLVSLAEI